MSSLPTANTASISSISFTTADSSTPILTAQAIASATGGPRRPYVQAEMRCIIHLHAVEQGDLLDATIDDGGSPSEALHFSESRHL